MVANVLFLLALALACPAVARAVARRLRLARRFASVAGPRRPLAAVRA